MSAVEVSPEDCRHHIIPVAVPDSFSTVSHGGWVEPYHLVPCTWKSSPYIVLLHITAWTCIYESEMVRNQVAVGTDVESATFSRLDERQLNSIRDVSASLTTLRSSSS